MKLEIPNSIEAEKSVIGSMFLSKYAQDRALETLNAESFYLEKHGKIFDAIKTLHNNQIAIDLTTVTDELKTRKILDEIGGVEYLTEILDETPTAANVDYYIKIVNDKSILRKLIDEANAIASLGYNSDLPLNETLEKAESKIFNVAKNRQASEFKTMNEVLSEVQNQLEKLSTNRGKISGLPTGL